jgi:raffinose synthase
MLRSNGDKDTPNDHTVILDYHDALAQSVHEHFGHTIVHCMAHAPEILFRLPSLYPEQLPLVRASDDHYPGNPHSHGPHIAACAFNSLFLKSVSVPDWDMFTTTTTADMTTEMVWLHALARAISGGPVYISDKPGTSDVDILHAIACTDGTVLTCTRAAVPIRTCLLQDPLAPGAKPLVLQNVNAESGVLGIFDLGASGEWNYDTMEYVPNRSSETTQRLGCSVVLSPNTVEEFRHGQDTSFVAWSFRRPDHYFLVPSLDSTFQVDLQPGVLCDVVTLVPIRSIGDNCQFAPLGFSGMINGAGSVSQVESSESSSTNSVSIKLLVRGCGTFQLALGRPSGSVVSIAVTDTTVDAQEVPCSLLGLDLISFPVPSLPQTSENAGQWITIDISF